jgi:large subunit ribosomal protein L1
MKNKKNIKDDKPSYVLEEAIQIIKKNSENKKRKFIESVDVAINLGIDSKQSDQSIKTSVLMPKGLGKKTKIIVFCLNDDQVKQSISLGVIDAGLENLITKIESGFLDFDVCIATPEAMPKITKLAKKLGPRGLMPSPKNGTVSSDLKKAIEESLKGKVTLKNDKAGTIHSAVGKVNFDNQDLIENIKAVLKSVKENKPESSKGKYIKDVYLSSSMGSSVKVLIDNL